MIEQNILLNLDDEMHYAEGLRDNLNLMLELVEVIRWESTTVGDRAMAEFMAGVSQIISVFQSSHKAGTSSRMSASD